MIDITGLSTFRLPARAEAVRVLESPRDVESLEDDVLILGGGSNTMFVGDFPGTVAVNRLAGIEILENHADRVRVRIAAGEDWHGIVRWSLDRGLYGLENLAMIPGSTGAAPMQNIGAYGVELSRVLDGVSAWDRQSRRHVELPATECGLAYRDSRFKGRDRGRFVITAVTLSLRRTPRPDTRYASLQGELERIGLTDPDPRQVAAAVMRVRRHRLPDPGRLPNAGSFFRNPIVDTEVADSLGRDHPDLPRWPLDEGRVKISAAWMIERLGWKGHSLGGIGVYEGHALVLVNHGGGTASQLLEMAGAIQASVRKEFGVTLYPEPGLVGLPGDSPLSES